MAILTIVIGLITPKLTEFFAGRSLYSEARRFVSMTRYAQSRAVSEGLPMVLWVDSKKGSYGLELETGYADADRKSMTFTVDPALKIDVAKGTLGSTKSGVTQTKRGALPGIHFSPDGSIISASSVPGVAIQGTQRVLWIGATANRLAYEVQPENANNTFMRR